MSPTNMKAALIRHAEKSHDGQLERDDPAMVMHASIINNVISSYQGKEIDPIIIMEKRQSLCALFTNEHTQSNALCNYMSNKVALYASLIENNPIDDHPQGKMLFSEAELKFISSHAFTEEYLNEQRKSIDSTRNYLSLPN
jgi:hypothetical protein